MYSNPADRSELKRETALETGPDHLGRSARNRGAHVAVGVVLQRRPCRITRDDPRQFGRAGAESLCQSGHAQPRQTTFSDTEAVDFVVHVERQPGRRIVREVLALRSYGRDTKRFLIDPAFEVKHATA